MPILSVLLVAASVAVPRSCSWDHPGRNPYRGDVAAAVDQYTDIPLHVRQRLQQRMRAHDYDDLVTISRDTVSGKQAYDAELTGMHFGRREVCPTVTRAGWTSDHRESGLVYCEEDQCVLVPVVCRNVSRLRRAAPAAAPPSVALAAVPAGELVFEPPGAIAPPPPMGPLSALAPAETFERGAPLPFIRGGTPPWPPSWLGMPPVFSSVLPATPAFPSAVPEPGIGWLLAMGAVVVVVAAQRGRTEFGERKSAAGTSTEHSLTDSSQA